ncbi:hypothetical protein WJU16_09120 [Chitinophaga pollutisoli]|uniref:Uncharacterized protein n=1 Tax=Chitinophaga pollutisoli TaxID=3133966 RepID=A0ABZ2YV57_9BACT
MEHYLSDEELAAIKQQMDALENQKEALRQRILNHFNSPQARRERWIKSGLLDENGNPPDWYSDRSQWITRAEYWQLQMQ